MPLHSPGRRRYVLSSRSDRYEQEAERVARAVVEPRQQGEAQNLVGSTTAASSGGPSDVALSDVGISGGHALPAQTRAFFEPRFGHDFSQVRIHSDGQAAHAARQLDAAAYTVGRHVVFAAQQFQPDNASGRSLLAHELTHVVQQATPPGTRVAPAAAASGLAISPAPTMVARQVTAAKASPAVSTVEDFDQAFGRLDKESDANLRQQLATTLVASLSTLWAKDPTEFGLRSTNLAMWLDKAGLHAEAQAALLVAQGQFLYQGILGQEPIPTADLFWGSSGSVTGMIDRGAQLAAQGRHQRASQFLVTAWTSLQMQLVQAAAATDTGGQVPRTADTEFGGAPRLGRYSANAWLYDHMRKILSIYPSLQRQEEAAGKIYQAAEYAEHSEALRLQLRQVARLPGFGIGLETSLTQAPRGGEALRLHGAEGRTTDVTVLPGQSIPKEAAANEPQVSSTEEIGQSLEGQVDLLSELRRQPAIQQAFGDRPIDLNQRSDRLLVWQTMFSVYQSSASPYEEPLGDLMLLIERYLKAFSKHTEYNIRDWGVSYLSTELPVDLLGRVERDCGVFALTVAYDLFRTAKAFPGQLNLRFTIVATTDHAMLVIRDVDSGSFYVVSNDEISGAHEGGGEREIEVLAGLAPGPVRAENEYAFTPAMALALGSTEQSDADFRREAWQRYLDITAWGLEPDAAANDQDQRDEFARREAAYKEFYERLATFDRRAALLDQMLTELSEQQLTMSRAGEPSATLAAALAGRLQPMVGTSAGKPEASPLASEARRLANVVNDYSRQAEGIITTDSASVLQRLAPNTPASDRMFVLGLLRAPNEFHPMVRTAMALLRLKSLGGSLQPDDESFIAWCRGIPMFQRQLKVYQAGGTDAKF